MASVPLSFLPPLDPDIVKLNIYESSSATVGFVKIDSTTQVGSYPAYITRYVTQLAQSPTDYFAISWTDSEGFESQISAPMQGGTSSLIGTIVQRAVLRNPAFNENIVQQEAEAVVCFVYNVPDPYSIDVTTVTPLWIMALVDLTFVASLYLNLILQSSSQGYSAGMISQSTFTGAGTSLDALERMERKALAKIGIGGSHVARIRERHEHGFELTGVRTIYSGSRLMSTTEIETEHVEVRDRPTGFIISER